MNTCAACGVPIGDEAWAAFREDAGFVADLDALTRAPFADYDVHERCRDGWTVPAGYSLAWEMPSVADRERRSGVEARRQSLSLRRDGDLWSIEDASGGTDGGMFLSGGRFRLPDGREMPLRMTLDEVETFLRIDPTGMMPS